MPRLMPGFLPRSRTKGFSTLSMTACAGWSRWESRQLHDASTITSPMPKGRRPLNWIAEHCGQRRPRVGFQIASFPTKAYRNWPLENFQNLGQRLRSRYPDAEILIFGDRPDSAAGEKLATALGQHCHCLAGKLSLRQTLALMEAPRSLRRR